MTDDILTYQELEHNCPLSCPFLRKFHDKHIFICTEYRVFLETDKYGLPKRSGKCGIKDIDNAKDVLKSLSENLDKPELVLTHEEKDLLKNIVLLLDNSERGMLEAILKTDSIAKKFCDSFHKLPQDNSLLPNTRALLEEYEEKYLKEDREKNRSRPAEDKQFEETKRQEYLRLLIAKNQEKSGHNL